MTEASPAQAKRNAEISDAVTACWLESRAPYCFIDNGIDAPPWMEPGTITRWVILLPGILDIRGLRIPLRTRWILCPAHEFLAGDEERAAS